MFISDDCGDVFKCAGILYAIHKYYVNERNRKKRLEFAQSYVKTPMEFWNRIFTDESKFNVFDSGGHFTVWRKRNEEYKPQNLQPTIKHGGGSICVWGATGVGELHLIDGTMDHKMYINILKTHLRSSAEKMGIENNFVFMQDNDPKHTTYDTRMWIACNTSAHLKTS